MYFGDIEDIEDVILNKLRKLQFEATASIDLKKIHQSSNSLHMHSLRAARTAGYVWNDCHHDRNILDPTSIGYTLENNIYNPRWLDDTNCSQLAALLQVCRCKKGKCYSCRYAKERDSCFSQRLCNQAFLRNVI